MNYINIFKAVLMYLCDRHICISMSVVDLSTKNGGRGRKSEMILRLNRNGNRRRGRGRRRADHAVRRRRALLPRGGVITVGRHHGRHARRMGVVGIMLGRI